ncbi:N-acetylglutaminylglutamine synthetase [Prosthecochloris sp. N3]|uniref:N-acetylglutaminylglutamine synthetase n=1 Tax=Prosthecochloris ethylica TaxID=2743976 RepID=A0ABR9XT78_9CHLB|nr:MULTISPECIES: N-acetylglutaminylglutamine synthetase [Prosthecochloris]MBF0585937.1 N-acetylglutaminylglutamine synthetase [Prosthecochloris ethylica]MBF0637058.1 N-acetylglutaminylglutamine synthetase [Prosthecochloris ethylica]NUK47295.1 N-acetylglutaminylglutamine synthetase [Prosthecochloris ethylica]RNA64087.1 N-acetylglutaminylglutamine synthetase [Prosthecochloris sp. ZM_2]
MNSKQRSEENLVPMQSPSMKSWGKPADLPRQEVVIECGWGRIIFGHTFRDNIRIAEILRDEKEGYRDIAFYLRDPQVVLSYAPQNLFIDPSYTFRLWLDEYRPLQETSGLFTVRPLHPLTDIERVNWIYDVHNMVPVDPDFLRDIRQKRCIHYWVAVENTTEEVIAVCMSIDHTAAFDDPENGSSLWALAVDPQAKHSGIGLQMVQKVAEYYKSKGRSFIDLSVLYSNKAAIDLYKKLGFVQVPVFSVKNKNAINEKLFSAPMPEAELNPYSEIIINEARRRGIRVDILDPVDNYFRLSHGGASVICRESLTELTSAIAMSRCADKRTTHRLLSSAGLRVPEQQTASNGEQNIEFLERHGNIVVKPADSEQGIGITVNVSTALELNAAVEKAKGVCSRVLLEEMVEGRDLRIIVIDYKVVAAAIRKPPKITGDGRHTIIELVKKQSRRREKASQGESRIPIDDELKRTVERAGCKLEDILDKGAELEVRKTANLHTGGTIHDVTDELHPDLAKAARQAAGVLGIPVTGLDFIVPSHTGSEYVIIEANERPGLANHEPQPTAERFIDFLFPQSIARTIS